MSELWINFLKNYLRLGFFFYFKKIKVVGRENIPKKGAVLFVGNHQNALLDPLLIGTTNRRNTHFLTRAGVFKQKIVIALFHSVQMLPVYRVRDGWDTLAKNEAIFDKCMGFLNNQKALVIFPEGSHSFLRRVRPLKKGFTRILFGALEKYPDLEIKIVPVGLNYNSITKYPASVTLHYGKPLIANDFWNKDDINESTNDIKEAVREQMKLLTSHIEDTTNYENIHQQLINTDANFLDPIETNNTIKSLKPTETLIPKIASKKSKSLLYYIVIINSIIPWYIWNKAQKTIKDKIFTSTFRYGLGITLFPLFYILQTVLTKVLFGTIIASIYFVFCILGGLILTKFSRDPQD